MKRADARSTVVLVLASVLAVGTRCLLWATEHPPESAVELVRETVRNEIASNDGGAKFMFRERKETPRGWQTKLVIETREATAGLLVEIDGRSLNPTQRKTEEARLDGLANNPAELRKKQKAERDDAERTTRIMRALPDAFLYQPDGTETGTQGIGSLGEELVKLQFRPNPKYSPPSRTEQVLTGMRGYLLIDVREHRIAKIDGTLFKDVGFGWGILGHLDKGGRFVVEQADVGDGHWEVTRMNLAFTGKAFFFRSINISSNTVFTDFHPAPVNLTFAEAVQLLEKQESGLSENHQHNGGDPNER